MKKSTNDEYILVYLRWGVSINFNIKEKENCINLSFIVSHKSQAFLSIPYTYIIFFIMITLKELTVKSL